MSPEEREQVVRIRRQRGYPLHAPPHPYREAGYYLITAAVYNHQPIITSPIRITEFENRLVDSLAGVPVNIAGWVILPTHYHVLVGIDSLNSISSALRNLHGATSREWNLEDDQTGNRRVWYKYSDRSIRSENHYYCALNYIHVNPMKHGYVKDPYEWLWSSLQGYYETQGREWLREQWRRFPPGDHGDDWDDPG